MLDSLENGMPSWSNLPFWTYNFLYNVKEIFYFFSFFLGGWGGGGD